MTGHEQDPHLLARFLKAQEADYDMAWEELRSGRKKTHWIWYIFPQLDGLSPAPSANTAFYSIKGGEEAGAYLNHPVLGARLKDCMEAILSHLELSAMDIFGSIDAQKVWSSATLFAAVSPPESVFHKVLQSKYGGNTDQKTLRLLERRR